MTSGRPPAHRFLALAALLAACNRSEPTRETPPPAAEVPYDDTIIPLLVSSTEEDNGSGSVYVLCKSAVGICQGLHLAPHRATTKLTISGPGGATISIGGAQVTLPMVDPPSSQSIGKIEVTIDYGALPLAKILGDTTAENPTMELPMKMKRKSGGEEQGPITLTFGGADLHLVLAGIGRRPTVFAGEPAQPAKPPILYSERGTHFYGAPKLVRDVDVIALWEPKERHKAGDCGPYKKTVGETGFMVERYLQDYDLRVVDRRSGKILAEPHLQGYDGGCPSLFVGKKGEPVLNDPSSIDADAALAGLRK